MDRSEKTDQDGLQLNTKAVFIPLGLSVLGIAMYFAGITIDDLIKSSSGLSEDVIAGYSNLLHVIGLWGLIFAFSGFLVVFIAAGMIYSMKTIQMAEPKKQEATDITKKISELREMESILDNSDQEKE
ncbi:MAG: hypothetical protein ACTSRU_06200 [Candidatus Hodarchaeales archaeon]